MRVNELGYRILDGEPPAPDKPKVPPRGPDPVLEALSLLRVECERLDPQRGRLLRALDRLAKAIDSR